jgi:enoyl-CoA hydratase/carnithine racemase
MSSSSDVFAIERSGHIATLWLDRTEKRNAMSSVFAGPPPRRMGSIAI